MLSVFFSGLFPYIYLQNQMTADIKQFNNQKLQRLKDTFKSNLFDPTFSLINNFVASSDIYNSIKTMESSDGTLNAYSIVELRDMLNLKLTVYGKPFHDILVFHEKDRKIISAKSGIRDLNDKSNKMQYDDEWIEELNELSPYKTIKWLGSKDVPDFSSYNFTSTLKCISVIIRLNPKLQSGSLVYICIRISESEIQQLIHQVNTDSQIHILLLTANGDYVLSDNSHSDFTSRYFTNNIEHEDIKMLINRASYDSQKDIISEVHNDTVYSLMKADSNDWYYLMTTHKNYYYKTTNVLSNVVKIVCSVIFIIMFFISLWFIFRLTSPFGDLLKIMSEVSKSSNNTGSNNKRKKTEIQLVVDAFSNLIETKNYQQQLLSKNQKLVSQSLVAQLLTGIEINNEELMSCIKFSGLSLVRSHYTVVLLQYISIHSDRAALVLSTIKRYVKEYGHLNSLDAEFVFYKFNEELYAVIMNHNDIDISKIKDFFSNLMSTLEDSYMVVGSAAIGSTWECPEDISKSYHHASDALCYATYYPSIRILDYEDTKLWDQNTQIDEMLLTKLIKSIQTRQVDNVCLYIKLLCDSIHNNSISYKVCMKVIEHIINVVETQSASMQSEGANFQEATLSKRVEECYFITDIFNCIRDFAINMIETSDSSRISEISREYTNEAISFMQKNYNKDITVQDIAEGVGVSRYHLSRIFKENTGLTLIEYLNKLRFSKAEVLLKNSEMNINEVAKAVGFNNISYFNRKFKQLFGITPSQFYRRTTN